MFMIKRSLSALFLSATVLCANADNLWIIGEATSYGWDTDKATAILAAPDSKVFSGTIYLKAGKDFKFMTAPDFGNEEYGTAPGATLVNGEVALAKGTDDTGYGKLQVAEDANYNITVNTDAMTATVVKSEYQSTQISICSLFMVGSAMPNGWDVMLGSPLYQNKENPCEFISGDLELDPGTFKIAIDLKGACSWNPEYWYFRDANDANKIARAQDGDLQWNIDAKDTYTVVVNVNDNAISITPKGQSSISSIVSGDDEEAEYYTLTGVKTTNPQGGIFICKRGNQVHKLIIR